jgi:hypothetical protein
MIKEFQRNERPSISMVAPTVIMLIEECTKMLKSLEYSNEIRTVAKKMVIQLRTRFNCLENPIYSIATLLDPMTTRLFSILPAAHKKMATDFLVARMKEKEVEIPATAPAVSFYDLAFKAKSSTSPVGFSLDAYLQKQFGENDSLLNWFSAYPTLKDLYVAICHIPAASSEVERLFSTSGYITSKLRCSMRPDNVEQRSLLKKNHKLLKQYPYPHEPNVQKLYNWMEDFPTSPGSFFPNSPNDEEDVLSFEENLEEIEEESDEESNSFIEEVVGYIKAS